MSGEEQEQERFEDYLELDRYLEELDAGGAPRLPESLTPAQARIYRMVALFRAASPGASEPRSEFASDLEARLLQEQGSPQPAPIKPVPQPIPPRRRSLVSRRLLLTGGSAIAASLIAGAGIDHVVEQSTAQTPAQPADWGGEPLVPADASSMWIAVTTLAELGDKVIPFKTGTIVGYVLRARSTGGMDAASQANWKGSAQEQVIALSAACTHMGCIVQWQDADRMFHCPCHGGMFNADGAAAAGASSKLYLRPLPRLDTHIDQKGNVLVRVPAPTKKA